MKKNGLKFSDYQNIKKIKFNELILFGYFLLLLGLASCNYNITKGQASGKSGDISGKTISVLDFPSVQKAVIGPQCLSCHSNSGGNKGGLNIETYDAIKSKLNQIYYRTIEVGDMPDGGLDPQSKEILKVWIENGAPLQATEGSGSIQGPLNWTTVKNKIIGYKCLECHSGQNPEGHLDLSDYEVFKSKLNLVFDRVFVKQDMPVAPYPALTISEKAAVLKWISQGLPK